MRILLLAIALTACERGQYQPKPVQPAVCEYCCCPEGLSNELANDGSCCPEGLSNEHTGECAIEAISCRHRTHWSQYEFKKGNEELRDYYHKHR